MLLGIGITFLLPRVAAHAETSALFPVAEQVKYSTSTAERLITHYAQQNGASATDMIRVARCESGFLSNAVGDHGMSYGLYQIHLPAHPTITKAQALDPIWSMEWAAKQFAKGNARIWTCFRQSTSSPPAIET